MFCWKCGHAIKVASGNRVGTREACPQCDSDLHACRNCRHYDPAKHNQCVETQAEWVRDKEAGNYCDYFWPGALRRASPPVSSGGADDAKETFDSLFKR
jgi:hypothetical protein